MPLSPKNQQVLAATVSRWFKNFAGTSALDVARDLSLSHDVVMRIFEQLVVANYGSMNADVELYQVSFDPENIAAGFKHESVITHIFFPAKQALQDAFFATDLPLQRLPEYTTRLHLGANQIGLVYFSEEVLARYLDHPEYYEVNDSLAGGDVLALSSAPEDRCLYVRYGKCRLQSGHIAVTAIYKDLSNMTQSEQRYWHSYEIESANIDKTDVHFQNFLARTYDGDFVDFDDPISRLLEAVVEVNNVLGTRALFTKVSNAHLRLPVEQTYKSHCDSANELYKIVGPDNISQRSLKDILISVFGINADDLKHAESGRQLSTLQLLALVEGNLGIPCIFTEPLRKLAELRIAATHKVLEPDSSTKSYSREFAEMCNVIAKALEQLSKSIEQQVRDA